MKLKREIVFLQIFLLISLSFSFSYILRESLGNSGIESFDNGESKLSVIEKVLPIYSKIIKLVFSEKNLVSAAESVYTCLEGKDGSICQQYSSSVCNDNCNSGCVPTSRDNVAQCEEGTCYYDSLGTCQAEATKQACESGDGIWFDDPNGNIEQCQPGCCLLSGGDESVFTTERGCYAEAEVNGIAETNVDFRSDINQEWACIALTKLQERGACVFVSDNPLEPKNDCKFGTKAECSQSGGDFYANTLCSHPELNTKCEAQKSSSCVDGKDEVYWFDSCGNRENIYSANKVQSFNDGLVLSKSESCSVSGLGDRLKNQETCGNCAYIESSVCGAKTSDEKLADNTQDFVCRDLSCVDSSGNKRDNGESWCGYQSDMGVDESIKGGRSVDTPGSRHFRYSCLDAEIRIDACADFRNEICVESQIESDSGGTFSTAACRINPWQQCLNYNTEAGKSKQSRDKRDNLCEQNPNCFIKKINVDSGFAFNVCAPKYPAGFDTRFGGESAEEICSFASQKCTVVYVKKVDGWDCVQNCACETTRFAEQMNDLCISIGDCGASVNYIGDLSGDNYNVKGSGKLRAGYLSSLEKYSEAVEGKYIKAEGNLTSGFSGFVGIPDDLGNVQAPTASFALGTMGVAGIAFTVLTQTEFGQGILGSIGFGGGGGSAIGAKAAADIGAKAAGGGASAIGAKAGETAIGTSTAFSDAITQTGGEISKAAADIGAKAATGQSGSGGFLQGLQPSMQGLMNVLGAAMTVFSIYSLYKTAFELGDGFAIAIITAAVVLGFISGFGGMGIKLLGGFNPIFIIAVAIIFAILGIGKTKKRIVSFECLPWQAPYGGKNCGECGRDGFPCSRYSCQSLGQTCELINANTDFTECIDINPNDVTAPVIKPLENVISENYDYVSVSDVGFKIDRTDSKNDGCVSAYEELNFGIELSEPALCKLDTERKNSFEEMEYNFGGRNLFLWNHTHTFTIPSMESLGLPGYDPKQKTDYDLYVKCKDSSGNENLRDYVINFCVRPGEDLTAPRVNGRVPIVEYVKHNQTNINATVFVNEPAECKYDLEDKSYDSMANDFDCNIDIEDREFLGWSCQSDIDISSLQGEEEKVFVKCKDQPWLIEDYGNGLSAIRVDEGFDEGTGQQVERIIELPDKRERNVNTQSYEFMVRRSQSDLRIEALLPEEDSEIISGFEPVSVELIAKTSGGVDGNAICSYEIGQNLIPFKKTGSKEHRQLFESFTSGKKSLKVVCEDIAGNIAERTARFEIKLDTFAPRVVRVFNTGGQLLIVTDEDAECAHVIGENRNRGNSCAFGFNSDSGDVFVMNGGEKTHTGPFGSEGTYYVKCKDKFGNVPGACNIIVKSGE